MIVKKIFCTFSFQNLKPLNHDSVWGKKVSCCLFVGCCGFFLYCVGGLSLRENQTLLSSSQLLVPCLFPLFVLIHFKFQLVGCDHAVFISVLVLEHVGDDLLHGQPGLYATFALCHLQLNELRKLKLQRSRTISHKLVSDHRSLACSNAKEKPLFHYVKTISNMNNNYLKLQFLKKISVVLSLTSRRQ